ncbi:MAG: uroporphyrinogen decarboxylase family protein [Limnochordia bacterium]
MQSPKPPMTNKQRLLTAASFQEADRVPIELRIPAQARALPECKRIVEFIDQEADNFIGVSGSVSWGFFGLSTKSYQEIVEDRPGEYRIVRRVHSTENGDFTALTKHTYPDLDNPDFLWIKHYIANLDDFDRLINAPRTVRSFSPETYREKVARVGERGVPIVGLRHPLGTLVRNADMLEVYAWIAAEPQRMHRFLEVTNNQIIETIKAMGAAGMSPWFITHAHEMLIPPWLGRKQFDEFVFPYDKQVNDAIHAVGGRIRAHCHGNVMQFLERMADMGIDATEPLEPPPYGDVDLAEAKRLVGGRMLLSGNIPSQAFVEMTPEEVTACVRQAIDVAAAGGGFTLRPTGGNAGIDPYLDKATLKKVVANVEAYIEAGLQYGSYH